MVANILRTDNLQLQIQPAAHRFLGPEQVMAIHKKCGSILGGIHLEAGGFTSVGFVATQAAQLGMSFLRGPPKLCFSSWLSFTTTKQRVPPKKDPSKCSLSCVLMG